MLLVPDKRAVVLTLRQPERVTTLIPRNQQIDEHTVAVRHGVEEVKILRNLGIDVPSPILSYYDWPGRYAPFVHQRQTSAFATLNNRCFILNDMGTGKTLSTLWAADYLMREQLIRRALILTTMSCMETVWQHELFTNLMHRTSIIVHGTQARRQLMLKEDVDFYILNHDGVRVQGVVEAILKRGDIDLVIVDECFVAGTMVTTPQGQRPIESLQRGDQVITPLGVSYINAVSKRAANDLVKLTFSDGATFVCTQTHPVFTDIGWVCANDCDGRTVFSHADLCDMQHAVHSAAQPMGMEPQAEQRQVFDLLALLWHEAHALAASAVQREEHRGIPRGEHRAGPLEQGHTIDGEPAAATEHVGQGTGAQAETTRWQRQGDVPDGSAFGYGTPGELSVELPNSGRQAAPSWLADLLQGGLWRSRQKDCSGGGREHTQSAAWAAARRQENYQAYGVRVDRVENYQRGGTEDVYNIEVADYPWYYAAGKLVHNCSAFRNSRTRTYYQFKKLLKPHHRLWMLTGQPTPNGPADAFGLGHLVSPHLLPQYFTRWQAETMVKINQFKWVAKPDAMTRVHQVLQPAIRFSKEDCLDLPPVVYLNRQAELSVEQQKAYRTMKEHLRITQMGTPITAVNAAVKLGKLLQICAGSVHTDVNTYASIDCGPRLTALAEVIEEAAAKTIVFIPYTGALWMVAQWLEDKGYTVGVVDGSVTGRKRTTVLNAFTRDAEPQVLVANPETAAHGLNLTVADSIVWFSPIHSLDTYRQACERTNRPGQKNSVRIVHLGGCALEWSVYKVLRGKDDAQQSLLDLYRNELAGVEVV